MEALFERLLGASGDQRTGTFDQDPFGADCDVAPLDDGGAFDVQRAHVDVLIDDQGAADVDGDGFAAGRQLSTPGVRIGPAHRAVRILIGNGRFGCGACGEKFEKAHRPMTRLRTNTKAL